MKILVVEDNSRLAERIVDKLKRLHSVDIANTGFDALQNVGRVTYDLLIIDLGLPDTTGLELCKTLRKLSIQAPILILTGLDDIDSKVNSLNEGADDYMVKPFNADELKARIRALGRRRFRNPPKKTIEYKDIVIDVDQRRVSRNGISINLRRKEFDILEYLISNSGRIMTREMILSHAWDDTKTGWTSTVDVHIKHLRDKIDRPFGSQIIKTAYGIGYTVDSPS